MTMVEIFIQWWKFLLKVYWCTAPCWLGLLINWLACKIEDMANDDDKETVENGY